MPLMILLWGTFYFFFGSIINANHGFGYDGWLYALVAQDFNGYLLLKKLSAYKIQKIFPSFVVWIILTISHIPKDNNIIVKSFQIYNLCLILLSSLIWLKISKIYKLSLNLIWVGFIFAFINFGVARLPFYYPVLTDTTALFLGFLLLYAHLVNNLTLKTIIAFLGAFTWPTLFYIGILLIIFPYNFKIEVSKYEGLSANKYLAFLFAIPILIIDLHFINLYFTFGKLYYTKTEFIPSFLLISALLNFLFISYFFYTFFPDKLPILRYFQLFKKIILNIKIKKVLICLFLFIIVSYLQKYFSNDSRSENSMERILLQTAMYSITKPFIYYVASVVYFGPAFIIFFFYLKKYKSHLKDLGIGVYLSFILSFFLLLPAEPRVIINFIPFITLLSVLVVKDLELQKTHFVLIAIFSLIFSQVYIPLQNIPTSDKDLFTFPNQLYFMNTYMISTESYLIHGTIVLVISLILLFSIRKNQVSSKELSTKI